MATETGIATGLWSRYGKVVHAPDWWLDLLPTDLCLDGELYNSTLSRQQISSVVTMHEPDDRWRMINFHAFDAPPECAVTYARSLYKLGSIGHGTKPSGSEIPPFITRYNTLKKRLEHDGQIRYVEHNELPIGTQAVEEFLGSTLKNIVTIGGEGIMVRDPWSSYTCGRVDYLLKVKPRNESTATIVGFTEGKGRLKGMIGALIVQDNGVTFELSGMKDIERRPGYLQVGTEVAYAYRTLSDGGVPIEAAYKGVVS
jgi:DNA ligase-1